jgi:peptidoglycan hydrolase-like protein with peptidoglycan-binding domain
MPAAVPRSLPGLDVGIDDNTAKAVLTALTVETDPAKLVALAHGIEAQYPMAASALLTKASALQAAQQVAQAATTPVAASPAAGPASQPIGATAVPAVTPTAVPMAAPAPVSFGAGNWTPATDADVARDGTAARFATLLTQPVGTTVNEDYGGRHWLFRVVNSQTDPGLTTFAKDVKAWVWTPAGTAAPAVATAPAPATLPALPLPTVTKTTYAAVPPNETTRQVQHALNVLGASPPLVEDGISGPKTIAAVKAFQVAHGLTVDGIAGPQTQGALTAALSALQTPPGALAATPAVVTVRDVQHALNVLGIASPPLVEDGIAGPKTAAAVKSFQQVSGLVVDGIAGPKTKAALSAALAQGMAA